MTTKMSNENKIMNPINKNEGILFTTLGMLVIDEIHFPSRDSGESKVLVDVVGGSGAWCTSPLPLSPHI